MIFNILNKHFVFRYSRILNVAVTCNGCKETINNEHFRCLSCVDADLCNKCIHNCENLDGHNNGHVVVPFR